MVSNSPASSGPGPGSRRPPTLHAGQKVSELKPDLFILDLTLSGPRRLLGVREHPRPPGRGDDPHPGRLRGHTRDRRERIMRAGADGFLAKPFAGRAVRRLEEFLPV